MHLISSDITLAEVAIVLVQGKTLAGWASTGEVAGNPYFIYAKTSKLLAPIDFYEKYIAPIV